MDDLFSTGINVLGWITFTKLIGIELIGLHAVLRNHIGEFHLTGQAWRRSRRAASREPSDIADSS